MTLNPIWVAVGGLIVAALSLILAFVQKKSGDKKQDHAEAEECGKTSEILRTVNDKLKSLDDKATRSEIRIEGFFERLVVVEQSAKQAHHRIDEHIQNK